MQAEDRSDEWLGSDPDYGKAPFVEQDLASDNVGVGAELGLPQMMAQDRDGVASRILVFFRHKSASQRGFDAQCVEIIGGREHAPDALRLTPFTQAERRNPNRGKALECVRLRSRKSR